MYLSPGEPSTNEHVATGASLELGISAFQTIGWLVLILKKMATQKFKHSGTTLLFNRGFCRIHEQSKVYMNIFKNFLK